MLFYQYGMGWGSWQPSAAMVGRCFAPPSVSSVLQGSWPGPSFLDAVSRALDGFLRIVIELMSTSRIE